MKGFGDQYKSKNNKKIKVFKEQTINQAINFHLQGNIEEASKYYQYCIDQNFNDHRVFSNFGLILKDLGKLQDAELSLRKAIELNPNYGEAYSNLGLVLIDLGKLQDAELSLRKAIELNPDFAKAYYLISTLKLSINNQSWRKKLFSKSMINNKTQEDEINIYFARANILHKEKNYIESSKNLILANNIKLFIKPSKPDILLNKSKLLLIETDKQEINQKEYTKLPYSIFIVGMPRSGSTLLESILTMNPSVDDLGESNILEESFLDHKKSNHELALAEIYWKKIKDRNKQFNKTTNKNLYNYLYSGIIAKQIPNAKIIHCYRNPLDNILSIFRAHFEKGNEYSSSLVDCANIYLNQMEIMNEYKNRFRAIIYDLSYDSLVSNPNKEIKTLINWLGWEWEESYLTPELNPRTVSTASTVQVRYPINSKSIGGWKNYKDMLKPAIEILTQTDKYQHLID